MIIFDFILVITWFPAAVIFHEKYIKCCLPGCTPIGIWTKMRGVCVKKDEYLPKPSKAHFMEEYFGGAFAQFLLSYHKLIVVFFLILTAASTFIWVTLLVPDTNNSGEIDAWELRDILKGLGRNPSDEELFELISLVDTNMSGTIDFAEFLAV